jgi:PKD repeat protein
VQLAPGAVSADGLVSLGLDSASSDGSVWGSSSYINKPELQVDVGGAPANRPPVAQAAATPQSGTAPLAVSLSSAGSSDPDGDALSYSWKFGDGTTGATAATVSHTYTTPGTYTAELTVNDGKGNSDSKTVTIQVGGAPAQTLTFTPEADTWVDQSRPTTSLGTSSQMRVDTDPVSQSFMRFRVSGVSGRKVTSVRLRLYQRDASRTGGRVFAMTSKDWLESMTWNTRPAIDGAKLAEFGAVVQETWYEVSLPNGTVSADGAVALAMDSVSSDGSTWGTREYTQKPQLIVGVE